MSVSLEQLYQEHFLSLYRLAVGLTGNVDEANDIIQTVFTRLINQDEAKLEKITKAYLCLAVRNGVKDFWKRHRPIPLSYLTNTTEDGEQIDFDIPDEAPNPFEETAATYDLSMILDSLQELTDEQREIISLKYFSGLTITELSVSLEKNENSLRQLEWRALRSLRRILTKKQNL